jgi:hypothetical protein
VTHTLVLLDDGVWFEPGGGGSTLLEVVAVARGGAGRRGTGLCSHAQGGQVMAADCSWSLSDSLSVALGVERNLSGQKCSGTSMADHFCLCHNN